MDHERLFHIKHIRRLIIALSLSGVLNIFLVSLLFHLYLKDDVPSPYFEQKPAVKKEVTSPIAIEAGNAELIHYFRSLTFDQLIAKLSNSQLIENGYTQRDIALACLTAFHNLDLTRSLLGENVPEQKRLVTYGMLKSGNPATLTVYPAITEEQFSAIIDFVKKEKWPITSKGIYWKLKRQKESLDPSLKDAFYMTQEFLAVDLLLNRGENNLEKQFILQMILEGSWAMLSEFSEKQKIAQDLSQPRRQRFLLDYIDLKSKTSALTLLKLENDFALKKLDDGSVVKILHLLKEKTIESEKYAIDILTSPRSDIVWKTAAALLYQYAGESIPDKYIHHMAMRKFVPNQIVMEMPSEKPMVVKPKSEEIKEEKKIPAKVQVPKKVEIVKKEVKEIKQAKPIVKMQNPLAGRKDRLYIIQDGDTLWKVSKKFNVHVDALRSYNRLTTDALKPGTPLRIP